MPDPWEMDWGPAPPAAAAPVAKAPWEMDWGSSDKPSDTPSGKSFTEKLGETSWGHLAKDVYSAVTLPGDVYAGKVDPMSPEGMDRARSAAMFMTPGSVAMRGGEGVAGAAITPREAELPANIQAAKTAEDLGAPLPYGLATDSKPLQAATKAAQQLPLVGPKIGEQAAKTVQAAGGRVGDIADELSGGVVDRASTGAMLRPSIKGVIETNNSKIDEAFTQLRDMLDHQQVVELPTTEKVLKQVMAERKSAGQTNPKTGLEDVVNLVNQGANFNGLQRARSDIGNSLNFGTANPGFNAGDLKRVYGAMSRDMEHVVSMSAKEGVPPDAAVAALKDANSTAAPIIEFNKTLQKLSGIGSDESLVGTLTKAAQGKTGNVKLLAQLRQSMPPADFEQIAGTALSELGHNQASGKFSLNQFATKWEGLGDRAKNVLFSPDHKEALDNIAALGRHMKDADKFANTSNTAGAAAWGKLIAGGAASVGALAYGDVSLLIKGLAGAGAGLGLASQLAKPVGAATIAKWSRAAVLADAAHTPARLASFRIATRNLLANLPDFADQIRTSLQQSPQLQQRSAAGR